jgi:hypothetical protein
VGGLSVDCQFELGRLLDRQVRSLATFQKAIGVLSREPKLIPVIDTL